MKVIIDRFEGDFAVVELPSGATCDVPRALFPGAREGDAVSILVDEGETNRRKEKIAKLMDDVWAD